MLALADLARVGLPLLFAAVTTLSLASRKPTLTLRGDGEFRPSAPTVLSCGVLFVVLYFGVFQALSFYGEMPEVSLEGVPWWQFFWLHGLLLVSLVLWYAPSFWQQGARDEMPVIAELGLRPRRSAVRDCLLGCGAGLLGWVVAIAATAAVAAVIAAFAPDWIDQEAPGAVVDLALMPLLLRLGLSLSAGLAEELFFRGFLQPRLGAAATTLLFLLAHAGYEQPLMMTGLLVLSVLFGILRERLSIWAAICAHATFDLVQLLVFIPFILRQVPDVVGGA